MKMRWRHDDEDEVRWWHDDDDEMGEMRLWHDDVGWDEEMMMRMRWVEPVCLASSSWHWSHRPPSSEMQAKDTLRWRHHDEMLWMRWRHLHSCFPHIFPDYIIITSPWHLFIIILKTGGMQRGQLEQILPHHHTHTHMSDAGMHIVFPSHHGVQYHLLPYHHHHHHLIINTSNMCNPSHFHSNYAYDDDGMWMGWWWSWWCDEMMWWDNTPITPPEDSIPLFLMMQMPIWWSKWDDELMNWMEYGHN